MPLVSIFEEKLSLDIQSFMALTMSYVIKIWRFFFESLFRSSAASLLPLHPRNKSGISVKET